MSTPLPIASNREDSVAVQAVLDHHAHLAGVVAAGVTALLDQARSGGTPDASPGPARAALVEFCRVELLPHAGAEETALYPLAEADPRARLLIEAMVAEHRTLETLVEELATAGTVVDAVAWAWALRVLFEQHLGKENTLVLPLLAASEQVSLASALAGMHDLLGAGAGTDAGATATGGQGAPSGGCGGACGCGGGGGRAADPVLDVRELPHQLRHGMVFGALDAVPAGEALVLLAPHDPLPLLGQLQDRSPDAFGVEYLESGPQTWRLRLSRVG